MKEHINIRIDPDLLKVIDMYGELSGIDRSKAIRELLKRGASNMTIIELQSRFVKDLEKRWIEIKTNMTENVDEGKNLIMLRDGLRCRKCFSTENLQVFNIDRDPLDDNPNNMVTLCSNCVKKA